MQVSGIPQKYTIAWGKNAGGSYINPIPNNSQIGVNNGYASFTDGFVPLNATPIASGGVPPRIQDTNGILNQITLWQQWNQAGASIPWDSSFSTAIGGYPKGATVASATTFGLYYVCLADNNTSNPDTGGANWRGFYPYLAGGGDYYVDSGTTNALVITPQPPILGYVDGLAFKVVPAFANTGATTINVSGLGTKAITTPNGSALSAGQITAGVIMLIVYKGSGFQYINAPTGASVASTNDIWAGSSDSTYVSPLGLKSAMAPVTLSFGSSIFWNMNNGFNATVTLTGNATMGPPTNVSLYGPSALAIVQGGSGNNTLAWAGVWDFGSVGPPTLSTGAGKVDLVWIFGYDPTNPIMKCTFFKAA